jgi:membrane-associated phospholipid phosphatase
LVCPSSAHADQEKTVQWNEAWPRVRLVEAANVVALTIGAGLIEEKAPYHHHAVWEGPILFDKPVRQLMRSTSREGQQRAADVSDLLYRGMVLTPYIVDNYFVTLGIHQNADVALQMTLINLQSLGISGVVTLAAGHGVGRQRPYVSGCKGKVQPDPVGFNWCGDKDDFRSFYSGHSAAMFTMAGLTCVHHQHLPLYGGGVPDALACALMLGLATTGSLSRIISDRHWATDVALGISVGIFDGYFLPLWLHYGLGWSRPALKTSIDTSVGTIVPYPQVYDGGAGLGLAVF